MFQRLGPLEIALILAILVLLFGAKKLPDLGKSMGKSIREFRSATKGLADDDDDLADKDAAPDEAKPASKAKAKGPAD
ncbi:MAG: twin-arginine translocase TatA/TatE family subunit [Actinomycetota bacterium]